SICTYSFSLHDALPISFESNFFKYFASNFNLLGIKKLIATSYSGSPILGTQISLFDIQGIKAEKEKEPIKIVINEVKDFNKDGRSEEHTSELQSRENLV